MWADSLINSRTLHLTGSVLLLMIITHVVIHRYHCSANCWTIHLKHSNLLNAILTKLYVGCIEVRVMETLGHYV